MDAPQCALLSERRLVRERRHLRVYRRGHDMPPRVGVSGIAARERDGARGREPAAAERHDRLSSEDGVDQVPVGDPRRAVVGDLPARVEGAGLLRAADADRQPAAVQGRDIGERERCGRCDIGCRRPRARGRRPPRVVARVACGGKVDLFGGLVSDRDRQPIARERHGADRGRAVRASIHIAR